MAEQIAFNVIADVLTKLGSLAVQQIGSAFGVAKELTKLTEKLEIIRGVLLDAEEKQEKNHAVKAWLRRLKDVVYDADDLLDDFATHQLQRGRVARQVSDFFSSSNQVVFRFKMSDKLKNIKEKVDEIIKESQLLGLVRGDIVQREVESSWRETHSFVLTSEMVGRDDDKEEIIKLLKSGNEKNLSAVAIIGLGGMGKTTLAQLVYSDKRVVEFFEPKIWICVSNDFNVKVLVKKILESLCGGVAGNLESLEALKVPLHEKLRQKKYLLVLDDVWNEDFQKWEGLRTLLMVGDKGSKILVTTRNRNVASTMGIDHVPFSLKGLKENESWNLFLKIAFEEGEKPPSLVEIGKEIVIMCKGVPLVIKTLGSLLRLTAEERVWQSIKENKNLLSLGAENDGYDNKNLLSILKLSYDNLAINLKQCFAYCALFPKDHKIKKKLLVQLWMAQGYIQPLDENIGHRSIQELLSRSLLEESEKDASNIISYKMHDLIHDLAQSVIGSEALILEDDVKEISKEVRHVSLFNSINLKLEGLRVKHLRTFLSIHHDLKDHSIRSIGSSNFKCLRVLSLNGFNIKKLPKCLGKLSHLRYLDLSHNKFEVLPKSITRLKNLQTLKLVGCSYLEKLPRDIRELINLRDLENDDCLSYMPCGIGELTLLQSLPVFVVGDVENGREVGRLSELKGLNNLEGELSVKKLENVRDVATEPREANLREKEGIRFLALKWLRMNSAQSDEDAETLMEGLHPPPRLEKLRIRGYQGMRCPSWIRNGGLSHLKSLVLCKLHNVENMLCSFPSLSKLDISDCLKLRSLELHSSPSLSKLDMSYCPKLRSLLLPSSPHLSQLKIWHCVDLSSLELHSSPSLSKLEIHECGLKSLLLPPSPHLSQLTIRHCDYLASLELHSSPLLSKLDIFHCPKLTTLLLLPSLPHSQLSIEHCGDLAFLPLPPSHLSQLHIMDCYELESVELQSSPPLSSLIIKACYKLKSLLLPQSLCLSELGILDCGDLTSVHCNELLYLETVELRGVREVVLRQLMMSATTSLGSSVSIQEMDDLVFLPDELHQYGSTLRTLTIRQCRRLATLPDCIGNLTSLTDLCIEHCPQLTSLPEGMGSLTSLTILLIRDCPQLTSLPEGMSSLTLLTHLQIWECPQLTSLPEGMSSLTLLTCLQIRDCPQLTSLPEGMSSLTSLTCLQIWDCPQLTSLPKGMGSLTSLTDLEIRNCPQLTSLPEGMGSLTSLTDLEIRNCPQLTSLPEGMGSLTLLTHLKIWDCPQLTSLPERMGSLTSLIDLEIGNCPQLTSLPEGMGSLTSLTHLRIWDCPQLTSLPEGMGSITSLTHLKIWNCPRLTSLPKGMGSLISLIDLQIGKCPQLTSLPEGMGSLTSLTHLQIWDCPQLTSLPEGMGSLTSLTDLQIWDCPQLTSLPEGMRSLTTLRSLDIPSFIPI